MMDNYVEQIVRSKAKGKQLLPLLFAWLLLMAGVVVMFFVTAGFGLLLLVVGIFATVVAFQSMNIEYEYIFTNGDLDIALIRNKASRKAVYKFDSTEVQRVLAYQGAKFQNELSVNQRLTVKNFTSFEKGRADNWYAFLTNSGQTATILELSERSLAHVKNAYKKVFEEG